MQTIAATGYVNVSIVACFLTFLTWSLSDISGGGYLPYITGVNNTYILFIEMICYMKKLSIECFSL